jgi:L-ascorbate metabolism protein UlaG (beta-lactamase superfamily)
MNAEPRSHPHRNRTVDPPKMRLTHVGGPTVLIELDGWRILTDPTFDPPGRRYRFRFGTSSTKTAGPAITARDLEPVDAVLLSHDHHADNLDDTGRTLLPHAGVVVTTHAGRHRLRGTNVRGLRPGDSTQLTAPDKPTLTIMATPCRHGPPLSRPIAGAVIGFALSLEDQRSARLWMTGDTVLHRPVQRVAELLDIDVLLMHLGAVRFPQTGPLRYSMNSNDALHLIQIANPRVAVPVHYEGWSHFSEPEQNLRTALTKAPHHLAKAVTWLRPGTGQVV